MTQLQRNLILNKLCLTRTLKSMTSWLYTGKTGQTRVPMIFKAPGCGTGPPSKVDCFVRSLRLQRNTNPICLQFVPRHHLVLSHLMFSRYPEFRDREGHFTSFYWHLLALRLGFVIMFEVKFLLSFPSRLKIICQPNRFFLFVILAHMPFLRSLRTKSYFEKIPDKFAKEIIYRDIGLAIPWGICLLRGFCS